MSAAYVQYKYNATGLSSSPVSATFDSDPTAGNLIVACVFWASSSGATTITGVTDTAGNTYQAASPPYRQLANSKNLQIWYAYNVASASPVTVSAAKSGTFSAKLFIGEFSGDFGTGDPLDGEDGLSVDALTAPNYDYTIGTVTPSRAGNLIIAIFHHDVGVSRDAYPAECSIVSSGTYFYFNYGVHVSAEAYVASASASSNTGVAAALALFKEYTQPWVDIPDFVEQEIPSSAFPSGAARVGCKLWTGEAGVTVQARLYDQTNGASVGESAEVTSQTPTDATFSVTLTSGTARYRLQVTSDTTDSDLFCQSSGVEP